MTQQAMPQALRARQALAGVARLRKRQCLSELRARIAQEQGLDAELRQLEQRHLDGVAYANAHPASPHWGQVAESQLRWLRQRGQEVWVALGRAAQARRRALAEVLRVGEQQRLHDEAAALLRSQLRQERERRTTELLVESRTAAQGQRRRVE